MTGRSLKRSILVMSFVTPLLLTACNNVPQEQYDALQAKLDQCQKDLGACNAVVAYLKEAPRYEKYSLKSSLLFASGSWQLSSSGKSAIAKIASKLAGQQHEHIYVNGYTDNVPIGADLMKAGVTTNVALSQKRADAVMAYMVSQGINANLISAHGYGEADPIASNSTASGRARNRRVELTLKPQM